MNPLQAFELYRFYHAGDDEVFALRGVSLQLRAGELLAVVGLPVRRPSARPLGHSLAPGLR